MKEHDFTKARRDRFAEAFQLEGKPGLREMHPRIVNVSFDVSAVLSSARQEHLNFARDVLAVCGIGYTAISRSMRLGKGKELSALYRINLRISDLPSWFFIIPHHLKHVNAKKHSTAGPWRVKEVRQLKKHEEVFSAHSDTMNAFGISEDLACGGALIR